MKSNGRHDGDPMRAHTSEAVQQRIDSTLGDRIRFYATQPKEVISRRLEELDQQWDIDRMVTANAAGVALGGVVVSLCGGGRKWLLLSGGVLCRGGCLESSPSLVGPIQFKPQMDDNRRR